MMAEQTANEETMGQLCDTTKVSGNYRKPKRRVVNFKELLNRPAPLDPPNIETALTDLRISVNLPTIEEIIMAIEKIKSGKVEGLDNTQEEALKAVVEASAKILHFLFRKIWDEEQVPRDCEEGLLIKIPKKGDLSKCDNYSGITLLSIPGKAFIKVLLNRMKDFVYAQLRDQQAGFRKDRSCTNQIVTLLIIVEQSIEWNL
ncbi:unnamed protein product [Schistosoma mattheei]|uniref:Uncharacterized protein n=1 Tax=Schistosoma mattheei TaxID=31246 RepID=A0A183Q6U6_9TREM|nr:unnamed protein product [Schistosoma mattheei]